MIRPEEAQRRARAPSVAAPRPDGGRPAAAPSPGRSPGDGRAPDGAFRPRGRPRLQLLLDPPDDVDDDLDLDECAGSGHLPARLVGGGDRLRIRRQHPRARAQCVPGPEGVVPLSPPAPWSAATYATNFQPLTTAAGGEGPYLPTPPATKFYVIEYDSSGHLWIAPPGAYSPTYNPGQSFTNPNVCLAAVR